MISHHGDTTPTQHPAACCPPPQLVPPHAGGYPGCRPLTAPQTSGSRPPSRPPCSRRRCCAGRWSAGTRAQTCGTAPRWTPPHTAGPVSTWDQEARGLASGGVPAGAGGCLGGEHAGSPGRRAHIDVAPRPRPQTPAGRSLGMRAAPVLSAARRSPYQPALRVRLADGRLEHAQEGAALLPAGSATMRARLARGAGLQPSAAGAGASRHHVHLTVQASHGSQAAGPPAH